MRASAIAANTASRGAATSHSSTNTYSREVAARIARDSARWTRHRRLRGVAHVAEVAHELGGGDRAREAEAVDVHLDQAAHERLAVARGAQLDAHAAGALVARAGELAVRGADRDGHRLALLEDVLAALDHEPHRALDHLVALGLAGVDVRLDQEAARAAHDVELEQLAVRLLRRLADLEADAQPRVLERGHVPRVDHLRASVASMDFDLSDEQQLIRDTAREFTDKEIVPRARENDRNSHFDTELVQKMADQGYLGAIVPREYGGAGLDYLTYALLVEEIGRGCSAMRTVVSVQTSLVCSSIVRWGTEEQKQRWLPRLCSGESLGCFGLTEPDTGSDAANQKTRAKKVDGGWEITGNKMWISLGNYAEVALIFAQTDPEKGHRGLAAFLVPTATEGFSSDEIHGKMGLHGSDTAALNLDAVKVDDDALMGEVGEGFKIAMSALDSGRYSVAAGCVGICQGSLDASVAYAKEREQFGRPIGSFQLVQAMIADMRVMTDSARMLVYRAGFLKDQGRPSTTETSIAKLHATESAQSCAHLAIQVHGGSGYVDDHPVERYFRDVRVTTLYEGTSQIQKLIIGRAETGLNALVPS